MRLLWTCTKCGGNEYSVSDKANHKCFKTNIEEAVIVEEVKEEIEELFNKVEPKVDYSDLEYRNLKSLAKEKGINTYKMKKNDIINALGDIDD